MRIRPFLLGSLAFTSACAYKMPGPPVPRSAMPVASSFGKTWEAVIDVFAARNIPIRTIERASGFISTEKLNVGAREITKSGHPWADCGKPTNGHPVPPDQALYNVRVKGDSARSTVQVTVQWVTTGKVGQTLLECSTKGVWESEAELEIKRRAEGTSLSLLPELSAQPPSRAPRAAQPSATAVIGAPKSQADREAAVLAFSRGREYVGAHNWTRAEQELRRALELDGSVAKYHAALGSLMIAQSKWDQAEAEFGAAALIEKSNASYRRQRDQARANRIKRDGSQR